MATLEVLIDPAGQMAQGAVADQRVEHVGGALEEVPVVTDHDKRARPGVEEIFENRQHLDVEIVRRFVEQKDIGPTHQQPHELEPALLATGEVPEAGEELVAGKAEALEQLLGRQGSALADVDVLLLALQRGQHAILGIEVEESLGQVGHRNRLADLDRAGAEVGGRSGVEHPVVGGVEQSKHGGLAGSVRAEEADAVAGAEPPGLVDDDGIDARCGRQGDVLEIVDLLAEPGRGELLESESIARRRLVRDELIGRVNTELGLGGTSRRATTQPRKLLA
ncbi:unannotated protein [freshwater metagenome]|uniref:Unannotated protein n=1 Tax=freshwater metagenome TaxID=449393 RepID=A0A6J7C458_9ZZZZ